MGILSLMCFFGLKNVISNIGPMLRNELEKWWEYVVFTFEIFGNYKSGGPKTLKIMCIYRVVKDSNVNMYLALSSSFVHVNTITRKFYIIDIWHVGYLE